jgi:hypothetical protein
VTLPAKPERIELKSLTAMLSPFARQVLAWEFQDWQAKYPERLVDEASMRYLFMRVLDYCGEKCPHPYRTPLPVPVWATDAFECRMCRSYVCEGTSRE